MSLLAPIGLALFALAAPLIALYLLKQKRQDRVVSSTLLWEKVLSDIQARHPFQRLRANLLLLLQLLVLAALALALARPAVRARVEGGRVAAIVLDVSASMQARDAGGGRTRFEAAKAAAGAAIAGMRPGDRAMLVLAGRTARTAKALTAEREELARALAGVEPEDVRGELRDAALLAGSTLRPFGGAGEIDIYGDGGGGELPAPAEVGAPLRFHVFGSGAENAGITAFEIVRGGANAEAVEVFATVENASEREVARFLGLYEGDRLVAGRDLAIAPRGEAATTFREPLAPGRVELRLEGKGGAPLAAADDALAADDRAYAVLEPPAPLGVAIFGPSHVALERALLGSREVEILAGAGDALARDPRVGLCIFDGETPDPLPEKPCLVFGARRDLPGVKVAPEVPAPRITGWERDHPLFRFVDLGAIEIAKARPLALDGPGRVLVRSDRGPLAVESRARRDSLVAIGVDLRESTWAGSEAESFVIFILNVIKAARLEGADLGPARIETGTTLGVKVAGDEEARLTPPGGGGSAAIVRRGRGGRVDFLETRRAGFYRVEAGGRSAHVAANLLDRGETRIAPRTELAQEGGGAGVRATVPVEGSREVWRWFVLLALGALVAEWWIFHRRL